MKKLFFAIFVLMDLSTSYAYDAKEIYHALNVVEENLTPGVLGALNLVKKTGRLECTKSLIVYPGATAHYECVLQEKLVCMIPEGCPRFHEGLIDYPIYTALDVEEIDVTPEGLQDAGFFEKEVGGLLCTKSVSYFIGKPGRYFDCELN